ncbi:MAG: hypothetical protein DRR42_19825 [Gammaproteobacteria bacterium]|nr:MAG: hypothetical protein DRR42_19825 [Gammaproteobacteria bacterium]
MSVSGIYRRYQAYSLLVTTVFVALVGCETLPTRFVSGLSAEQRALAAQIPVYFESLAEGSYRLIGQVEGLSCQITYDDEYKVSKGNAIEELQRAAFKKGGNTVIEVSCAEGADPCFRSIACQGNAVHVNDGN